MSCRTMRVRKAIGRAGVCLFAGAALAMSFSTAGDTKPVVIRGIPAPAPSELRLAYLANFSGSLDPALDKLGVGALQFGPFDVPGSDPAIEQGAGEIVISDSRPVGLDPDVIPAAGVWAAPVHFGPGTISRIRATFIAPVGPLPGGGFAI